MSDAVSAAALLIGSVQDVRWGDMDAFNHVNNATYLRYIEQARIEWFETLGPQWLSDSIAPIMAAAHINYRRPIEYPARIRVELYAQRLGGSSITVGHRIVDNQDPSLLYADGDVVLVWIDRASGRSIALPEFAQAACERAGYPAGQP